MNGRRTGRPRRLDHHYVIYVDTEMKREVGRHKRIGEVENDVVRRAMRELNLTNKKDKKLYGMED